MGQFWKAMVHAHYLEQYLSQSYNILVDLGVAMTPFDFGFI